MNLSRLLQAFSRMDLLSHHNKEWCFFENLHRTLLLDACIFPSPSFVTWLIPSEFYYNVEVTALFF